MSNHSRGFPNNPLYRRVALIALIPFLALASITCALGRNQPKEPFDRLVDHWNQTLERAKAALDDNFARVEINRIKGDLQSTLDAARRARSQAQTKLDTAAQLLQSLASPPAANGTKQQAQESAPPPPTETPQVTALRKEMQGHVSKFQSQVTQTNLIIDQTNDLISSVVQWEQARIRAEIFKHDPPPIHLQIWPIAAADALVFVQRVIEAPLAWWNAHHAREATSRMLAPFLIVPFFGLVVGWLLRRWLTLRCGRDAAEEQPSYARRIVAAVADGLANAIMPAAIVVLTILVIYLQDGVLTGLFALLFYSGSAGLAAFLMIMGLTHAAISPHLVAWRIIPVQPAYAYRLIWAIRGVTASLLVSLALLITAFFSKMLSPELESAFFIVQITLTSLLMAWALTPSYWETSLAESQSAGTTEQALESAEHEEAAGAAEKTEAAPAEAKSARSWFDLARKVVRVAMLLTPFVALAGYGRFAFYIQSRLVAAIVLIGFAVLLRLAIEEMVERWLTSRRLVTSGHATKDDAENQRRIRGTMFWIGMAVNLLVYLPLLYVLLLTFSVPPTTLQLWLGELLSGIQIGSISISLGAILFAILVLIVGVVITNIIRHWLTNRMLPNTRLDIGARNSIASATGYLGVAVTLLVVTSTLGVNLSSLALVAGALSVGIGFGLQNVVQNFVAGLLMLIERPIKVGDWIVVGTTEGTVKRIAVRSTEIETFDRASVIVPNSEFISSPVTNWTYKNRMRRAIIPIGVAYGSDTKKVARLLLRCAQEHRHVLRYPTPVAYFIAFGDSSLNFELRFYVRDTDNYRSTISDLNFAVDDAFRRESIEIPFPQLDLYLRNGSPVPSAKPPAEKKMPADE